MHILILVFVWAGGLILGVQFQQHYTDYQSITTLPDYEMAVGLCVNNDGVDFMTINSTENDYMELVTCINGAEFKLNPPSTHIPE